MAFVLDAALQITNVIGLEKVQASLSSLSAQSITTNISPDLSKATLGTTAAIDKMSSAMVANEKLIQNVSKSTQQASKSINDFGDRTLLAGRRYAAFVTATAVPIALVAGLRAAINSIVEFDTELTKLSQITGIVKEDLSGLSDEMIRVSTETGTALGEIANAARTLAQAGFLRGGQEEIERFLEPISKVPLLPTFDNIEQGVEAVITALGQFGQAGLEPVQILDKLTKVADNFAVTSNDLTIGLQKGGGAFAALGGDIDEFIALFTTLRATTRESAGTIGTAIKTISARLARPTSIAFLENIGVQVRNSEGQLLGLIEILQNTSEVFDRVGTEQQAIIGEQLGGLRQISRLFAALRSPEIIQDVLATSRASAGALEASAEVALQSISAQINLVKAEFVAFAQSLSEPLFQPIISGALTFGKAIAFIAEQLKPILPLLTQVAGFAAGFKLLEFSIRQAGKAIAALGAAQIGGIGGVLGGISGQQQTQFVPSKGFAGNQLGQIGGLVALNLTASKLNSVFESQDAALGQMIASTIETSSKLLIFASLLSGRSVFDLFKGLGALSGILSGIGIIGFAGAQAVSRQTEINIDNLVNEASKKINSLKTCYWSGGWGRSK
jgi:TP901 family phage tail tape measure protein